ncbi:hypothetical protein Bestia_00034 [Acinetobacter phage Bestia]|nr:hypothetical protein Bestia_00034 [Acinetobacter phage Bestia]
MIKNLVKKKTKEEEPKPEWYHEHMKKVATEKKIQQDEEDKKAFLKKQFIEYVIEFEDLMNVRFDFESNDGRDLYRDVGNSPLKDYDIDYNYGSCMVRRNDDYKCKFKVKNFDVALARGWKGVLQYYCRTDAFQIFAICMSVLLVIGLVAVIFH